MDQSEHKAVTLYSHLKSNTTPAQPNPGWVKKNLLGILAMSRHGHLVLKEQGLIIATFGDEKDELHAEINVLDTRCYAKALLGGDVAAGEAFVDGWWTTPDITNVTRFFSRNLGAMDQWERRFGWLLKPVKWTRLLARANTRNQAKKNILAHYDVGNELYSLFLDKYMQYSAGLFLNPGDDLDTAQFNKMQRLCEKLQLTEEDHLLEIGTGWGGLAIHAARHFGCQVTSTTISDAQFKHAKQAVRDAGLEDRITILSRDYRELSGCYDKLVSVEMIEAVGKQFLPGYFDKINSLVKPGGAIMIQAITIADQRQAYYGKGEDFIQKYIFPGGFLPSIQLLSQLISDRTEMIVRDISDLGLDYARTLHQWRQNFYAAADQLEAMGYGDRFRRLWEYYFGYCEGGFLERRISTIQLLATRSPDYNC